eukprot:Gb_09745 [translate_table: standard]
MGKVCGGVWLLCTIALLAPFCSCNVIFQESQKWGVTNRDEKFGSKDNAHSKKKSPQIFELHKGDLHVKITNWGATIMSLSIPDAKGHLADVVLGFDTVTPYMASIIANRPYFGAIVGRVANRIKNAQFKLNGITYHLPANNGNNTIHGEYLPCALIFYVNFFHTFLFYGSKVTGLSNGGLRGFDNVLWDVKEIKGGRNPSIKFTYHSFDGEQGFPGDLDVSATYTLQEDMELRLDMKAIPRNKLTPVSLVQHTYWNLAGHNSGKDILGHLVRIWGSHYTPSDKALIPTGQILPVKGTPVDFTKEATVGSRINELPGGYDHNYVLDIPKIKHGLRRAARVKDPSSCRVVEVWTNKPGMQFYTSNTLKTTVGKGGAVYKKYSALCLETQAFPNAVNQPNFPSVIVYPGKVYSHTMVYKFSVDKE